MARDTRCAIIGVHHTVKTSIDGTALGAIGGPSGGLAGTARAVYVYGYDPDEVLGLALRWLDAGGVPQLRGDTRRSLLVRHVRGETSPGTIIGQVGLAGKVVVGTMGYRAQKARPRRLFVSYFDWQLVRPLRETFNIPVELTNTDEDDEEWR